MENVGSPIVGANGKLAWPVSDSALVWRSLRLMQHVKNAPQPAICLAALSLSIG